MDSSPTDQSVDKPDIVDSPIAQEPDSDVSAPGKQFGAGCFWGVELAFQRIVGVTKTEVGYTQGISHNPSYKDVCTNTMNHTQVVRIQCDPNEGFLICSGLDMIPPPRNRQEELVGAQYRSGIYFYTPEQEKLARESLEKQQEKREKKIVTEILPANNFYKSEEYHQRWNTW